MSTKSKELIKEQIKRHPEHKVVEDANGNKYLHAPGLPILKLENKDDLSIV